MSLKFWIACTVGRLISLWIHFIIYKWLHMKSYEILQHFICFYEPINKNIPVIPAITNSTIPTYLTLII